jgi:predicted DNA-binding transcriptional regulator YafY
LTGGVPSSTSRLLALLETLQAQPFATGRELADRLEVDVRTLRRYIAALQELGIPIEGQRGAGGGYRMRPGYRLPPLMLSDDEAVVVALGLVAAQRLGLDTESAAAGGALAKIRSRRRPASPRPPRREPRYRARSCSSWPTRSGAGAGSARGTVPLQARCPGAR